MGLHQPLSSSELLEFLLVFSCLDMSTFQYRTLEQLPASVSLLSALSRRRSVTSVLVQTGLHLVDYN